MMIIQEHGKCRGILAVFVCFEEILIESILISVLFFRAGILFDRHLDDWSAGACITPFEFAIDNELVGLMMERTAIATFGAVNAS